MKIILVPKVEDGRIVFRTRKESIFRKTLIIATELTYY